MTDDRAITQAGFDELKKELETRKTEIREKVAEQLRTASDQGDLSENAAYKSAMEDKEFNENRILDLEKKIATTTIEKLDKKDSKAGLGETVIVKRMSDGALRKYKLVGDTEADPSDFKISVESPIGQALYETVRGQKVMVDMPNGAEEFEIVDIK